VFHPKQERWFLRAITSGQDRCEGRQVRSRHDDPTTRHDVAIPSGYTQPAACYSGDDYKFATQYEISMARKKSSPGPQHIEPEDKNQDIEETQGWGQEGHGFAPGPSRKMSKTDAIRAAVAERIESPGDGVDFIRKRFGIEMSKGHFSATKSKLKSAEAAGASKGGAKKSAPAAATKRKPEPVGDYQSPPEQPAGRDGNLLDALEQMKPLIAQYGPDHVKRMVDLLG